MGTLRTRRSRRGDSGAELVEFALVLPLLLLVIVGIFDFGFLFRDYGVITNAAREGARIGVLAGYAPADIELRAKGFISAAGLDAGPAAVTVTTPTVNVGGTATVNVVRVQVTYPHTFTYLAPFAALFGGSFGTITLTAVSTMRVEAP